MTSVFKFDMIEVLRLTREGRVQEATALLRGAGGPATAPPPGSPPPGWAADDAPIDLVPPRGANEPWTVASPPEDTSAMGLMRAGEAQVLKTFNDMVSWWDSGPATPIDPRAKAPPTGGSAFEDRTYSGPTGTATYKLYIPSGYKGEPLPLVVMLHGCSQSPEDFAVGTRMNDVAEEHTVLVAYPAQSKSANPSKCWNWFESGHQARDRGEPALIAGITREIMREFPVNPGQVFIAGLSAGGAAAAIMGEAYPDLYAAIGVHSGLACGAASDMTSAFGAMRNGAPARCESVGPGTESGRVPTIVFHGDQDTTVHPANGDHVTARVTTAAPVQTTVEHGVAGSGMRYTRTIAVDDRGRPVLEHWVLQGAGHAWSGGNSSGSFADSRGPDASREMMRFFLQAGTD